MAAPAVPRLSLLLRVWGHIDAAGSLTLVLRFGEFSGVLRGPNWTEQPQRNYNNDNNKDTKNALQTAGQTSAVNQSTFGLPGGLEHHRVAFPKGRRAKAAIVSVDSRLQCFVHPSIFSLTTAAK